MNQNNFLKKQKEFIYNITALTSFFIAALILTYPLIFKISTHIPGGWVDSMQNIWNLWWIKTSLVELKLNPFFTKYIFYPTGVDLYLHTLNIHNGILSIPFQKMGGLVFSYNVILIFSFTIAGFGAYLLIKYLTKNKLCSFIGGLVYTFNTAHFVHAIGGHLQVVSTEYIPFFILFLIKTHREEKMRYPILAGFFLFLTTLCDGYYLYYLFIFLFFYIAYMSIYDKERIFKLVFLRKLFLLLFVFIILICPVGINYFFTLSKYQIALSNLKDPANTSCDLFSFVTPYVWHPFLGSLGKLISKAYTVNMEEQVAFIGYITLLLVFYNVLVIRKKEANFWKISALFFAILCLGPILHIFGQTNFGKTNFKIYLPYALLNKAVPFFSITRSPGRFNVMLMLSISVLAGYSLQHIFYEHKIALIKKNTHIKNIVFFTIIFLMILEHLTSPFLVRKVNVPTEIEKILDNKDNRAVLYSPNQQPNEIMIPEPMYYHAITNSKKPIVNGYVSYVPDYALKFLDTPLVRELSYPYLLNDNAAQNLENIGIKVLNTFDIGYIVIFKKYFDDKNLALVKDLIENILHKEPTCDTNDILIFQVDRKI